MKIIIYSIIVFFIFSCTFEPWKTIQYSNLETENIGTYGINSLPDEVQFRKNYLNGAFIMIGTKGKDATVYSSKEPYALFISLTGKTGEHINISINNLEIVSSSGYDYTELIAELPINIDFETINTIPKNDNYVRARYYTDYIFDFFDDKIYISFQLEVTTKDTKEKKEMSFTLTRKIKRGIFQSYW